MNDFVKVSHYATTAEAEMHAEILREAGIAAIIQGPQAGMFGAGFSGYSVQGVKLLVPESELARALELIDDGTLEEDE